MIRQALFLFGVRAVACTVVAVSLGMAAVSTGQPPADAPTQPPSPIATGAPEPAAIPALPDTPAGRVMTDVLKGLASAKTPIAAELFNDAFQKQVPPEKVQELCAQLIGQNGAFSLARVDKATDQNKLVVTVKGTTTNLKLQVVLGLDQDGKMETLLFRPAPDTDLPPFASWEELDRTMGELDGEANFGAYALAEPDETSDTNALILRPVHLLRADKRLAIGSTFKLYVLGALAEAVAAGALKWDEALAINAAHKSLPSGTMQGEPEGKSFPISVYAQKMISISDNTATDHLIRRVTRESVEKYMTRLHGQPALNEPFLTTLEMFALKLGNDQTLMPRWISADLAARREMLAGEVATTQPNLLAAAMWSKPRNIDTIEWFASADELARLMADLRRLELQPGLAEVGKALRLNPGLPLDTEIWQQAAFKGGSEPGVLNLTWLLTHTDGRLFIITLGWNNTADKLDENRLLEIAPRALGLLAKHP